MVKSQSERNAEQSNFENRTMTSKPLVFHAQHMLWQQRIDKERGTELRVKDEIDMFKTYTDTLPG